MAKTLNYRPLITVIFIYEGRDQQATYHIFKSVINQIYKNMEIIVAAPDGVDVSTFRTEVENDPKLGGSEVPIYYNHYSNGMQLIDAAIKDANGELIFLKTSSPSMWTSRHTLSHILQYQSSNQNRNINVCFSLIEFKNLLKPLNDPFSTLGYRIQKKITVNDVILDELSFKKYAFINNNILFTNLNTSDPESANKFLNSIKDLRYSFENEISLMVYVPVQDSSAPPLFQQPVNNSTYIDQVEMNENDELSIIRKFSTVVGNIEHEAYNQAIRSEILLYEKTSYDHIKTIAIKRTMGMGDVLLAQPFINYISDKYPSAKITFYTSKERSCQDMAKLFPEYKEEKFELGDIDSTQLSIDFLGTQNDYDLKYDLDLSYESRKNKSLNYAKSYFEVAGFDVPESMKTALIQLDIDNDDRLSKEAVAFIKENDGKYISANIKGSGWGGKELHIDSVGVVLDTITEHNLKLVSVSELSSHYSYNKLTHKFAYANEKDNFFDMVALIQHSSGYIGSDSGPMHVAVAGDKPILIWQGAALLKNTSLVKDDNYVLICKEELSCLGCKHNFFYNIVRTGENTSSISFVPPCIARYSYICMNDYETAYIVGQTNKFIELL